MNKEKTYCEVCGMQSETPLCAVHDFMFRSALKSPWAALKCIKGAFKNLGINYEKEHGK